ncbi:hypothetical protein F2P81_003304 [Scophthalmus maximus]|uniref:Uncharacterized protein n=1 Tax=Scophthalmus maximus TaxID=52904 RepID=A0A6A4T9A1_SCOMX|nr:hypothetical protein F2P81_003304 [Scophthalmus maximus]
MQLHSNKRRHHLCDTAGVGSCVTPNSTFQTCPIDEEGEDQTFPFKLGCSSSDGSFLFCSLFSQTDAFAVKLLCLTVKFAFLPDSVFDMLKYSKTYLVRRELLPLRNKFFCRKTNIASAGRSMQIM